MSNTNLFRKGLATSAIAALGVSVLTGVAPASAVDPAVSLELSHGTSTNVKTWDFAELKAGFSLAANPFAQGSYYTGDSGDTLIYADANYSVMPISYLVESLDGADVYGSTYDGADAHGDRDGGSTGDYYSDWDDQTDFSLKDWGSTANVMVLDGGYYHNVTNRLFIDLNNAPTDKASRVKVTAFLDHNGDEEITVGTDESAAPITITFNRPSDLSVTTTLAQPIVGDDELTSETVISPVLNDDFTYGAGYDSGEWNDDMAVKFTVENFANTEDMNGDNYATMDYATYSDGIYAASESDIYDGNSNLFNVIPGNYEAQALIYGELVGNVSRKVVAARVFNDVDFDTDSNNNLNYYNDYTADFTGDYTDAVYTADYAEARQGTQVETYTVKVYGVDGEYAPAGTKVDLVVDNIYDWSVADDIEIKVNGAVVEYGDSVELTVGANGVATFTVQNTSAVNHGDYAVFVVYGENWLGSEALWVEWESADFELYDLNGTEYSYVRNITSGGSYTFNLGFDDQWGVAPTNGLYRVLASGDDRIDFDTTATNIVNGRASVTVTDDANTDPQSRDGYVNFEIEKLVDTDTIYPYWEDLTGEAVEDYEYGDFEQYSTKYYVQNAGRIVVAGSDAAVQAASGAFLGSVENRLKRDTREDDLYLDDMIDSGDQVGYVNVYVRNAVTDIARAGAAVTFSAAGFQFSSTYGDKLAENTFTSHTDNAGWAMVYFSTHTKGTKTITITSGSVSTTLEVTVDNLAAANVAVSQVANSQAGKTLVSTATVTDKWGNSVDEGAVTFASNFGTVPVASVNLDDNGVAVGLVEVGVNDLGTATVTATTDAVVGTATTTFGTTDGHVFKNKRRVTATWEFAKGKTVAIYRDGRRVRNIPVATDDLGKFSFNVTKGKHNVTLKIAGVTVYSYTFNVK